MVAVPEQLAVVHWKLVPPGQDITGAPESGDPPNPMLPLLLPLLPPSSPPGLPELDLDEQPEPGARAMSPSATKKVTALVCRLPMAKTLQGSERAARVPLRPRPPRGETPKDSAGSAKFR